MVMLRAPSPSQNWLTTAVPAELISWIRVSPLPPKGVQWFRPELSKPPLADSVALPRRIAPLAGAVTSAAAGATPPITRTARAVTSVEMTAISLRMIAVPCPGAVT
jgi:hypothetical protein